jgi:hypothetical protein
MVPPSFPYHSMIRSTFNGRTTQLRACLSGRGSKSLQKQAYNRALLLGRAALLARTHLIAFVILPKHMHETAG